MKAFYVNKKGTVIPVKVTLHAMKRFQERYRLLTGNELPWHETSELLHHFFKHARREELGTKKLKKRAKRHIQSTIYFRRDGFRFVVCDGAIVTVEIATKDSLYLNCFSAPVFNRAAVA